MRYCDDTEPLDEEAYTDRVGARLIRRHRGLSKQGLLGLLIAAVAAALLAFPNAAHRIGDISLGNAGIRKTQIVRPADSAQAPTTGLGHR